MKSKHRFSIFLSTPSGWRATGVIMPWADTDGISIHALRVEGDQVNPPAWGHASGISIHALRVEGDSGYPPCSKGGLRNFYPRPPGGGRHFPTISRATIDYISIHALRVEGDSTSRSAGLGSDISIHALRVEGDGCLYAVHQRQLHFYPRPPGGGRHSSSY